MGSLYFMGLTSASHVLQLWIVLFLPPDMTTLETGPQQSSCGGVDESKPFGSPTQLSHLEALPPPPSSPLDVSSFPLINAWLRHQLAILILDLVIWIIRLAFLSQFVPPELPPGQPGLDPSSPRILSRCKDSKAQITLSQSWFFCLPGA